MWGEDFEDDLLSRIAVERCLDKLNEADRTLLEMSFSIRCPDDYKGPWPATFGDIGRFLGLKYGGRAMSEATIRYRRVEILSFLQGRRGPLRGNLKEVKTTPKKGSTRPTSMDNKTFEEKYLPKYLDVIEAIARKLSNRIDEDLFQDLRSVGMETLWRLDLTKAKANEDAYIRRALSNGMVQFLRRARPKNYKSLQKMLEDGDQVVKDGVTGEATFVDRMVGRRNALEDEDGD